MKRLTVIILVVILGIFATARRNDRATWYYNVDQKIQITPTNLDFEPTSQDLLCAALLEPGSTPSGGVTVTGIELPADCPANPPVVVWGTDPDTGDTIYAALVTVKFWGKKRSTNGRYGVNALINTLKNNYGLKINASGDLDDVDAQFLPPLTTPPVDSPVTTSGWYAWQSGQTISLKDPEVSDVHNYSQQNRRCQSLFKDRCWSALLTWALPVRLVVHGDENGSYQITVSPGHFRKKSASTLSVSDGELTSPEVLPAPK